MWKTKPPPYYVTSKYPMFTSLRVDFLLTNYPPLPVNAVIVWPHAMLWVLSNAIPWGGKLIHPVAVHSAYNFKFKVLIIKWNPIRSKHDNYFTNLLVIFFAQKRQNNNLTNLWRAVRLIIIHKRLNTERPLPLTTLVLVITVFALPSRYFI